MSFSESLGPFSRDGNFLLGDNTGRTISRRVADGAGTSVDSVHGLMAIGTGLVLIGFPALPVVVFFGELWRRGGR